LEGQFIIGDVNLVACLTLELCNDMLLDHHVEVLSAKMGVSIGRPDFEEASCDTQN
jgi:hypothetical protein